MKDVEPYIMAKFHETLFKLNQLGLKVILVGQIPLWVSYLPKAVQTHYIMKNKPVPEKSLILLNAGDTNWINESFRKNFKNSPNLDLIIPTDTLCNEEGCLIRIGDNLATDLISFDQGHLTWKGSRYIADKILGPAILKAFK
jgi:hypothetical protein